MRKLLVLVALAVVGCSGADPSEAEAFSKIPLRFDVATILEKPGDGAYASFNDTDKDHCAPVVVPTVGLDGRKHYKCLREAEWSALNYPSHHWLAMPTDSHRSKIEAAGNDLAGYVDRLNAGYGSSGNGTAEGVAAAEGARWRCGGSTSSATTPCPTRTCGA